MQFFGVTADDLAADLQLFQAQQLNRYEWIESQDEEAYYEEFLLSAYAERQRARVEQQPAVTATFVYSDCSNTVTYTDHNRHTCPEEAQGICTYRKTW